MMNFYNCVQRSRFVIGLITVIIVLIVIGIGYLLKKHLPERIEKILVDELEKGKLVDQSSYGSAYGGGG